MATKNEIKIGDLVRLKKPYFTNDIGLVIGIFKDSEYPTYRIRTLTSLVVISTVEDIEVLNKA
jgi:hypothetical protein